MHQPYPASQQLPASEQPPTVLKAVKLMQAGAVLSAIEALVGFIAIAGLRSQLEDQHPNFSSQHVESLVIASIIGTVLFGAISIGLWIFMAKANGAGKPWARIVASVLFALITIDLFATIAQGIEVDLILLVLMWLAGLGATVLLWRRESADYFQPRQP